MVQATRFSIDPIWQVLITDLGLNPHEVLTRAELPLDLLGRKNASVTAPEYFRLWDSLESSSNDPNLPLKIGQCVPVEAFNPPIFAALCSPNLNIAMGRLSHFKKLIGPMTLTVDVQPDSTEVTIDCLYTEHPMPTAMIAVELVFLTQLVRLGTRQNVCPLKVTSVSKLLTLDDYTNFFGVRPRQGDSNRLTFSATDALRPFLTKNELMWKAFEPDLRQRLTEMEADACFASKVRSALLEMLPSGLHSAEEVAKKLAVSKRTLQRRLNDEATTFQIELNQTREGLARHYLKNSELPGAQISFLIGFDDPNSFVRTFNTWTGTTPEKFRAAQ